VGLSLHRLSPRYEGNRKRRNFRQRWDWHHATPGPGQAAAPSAAPSVNAGGHSGRKLTCRQIGSYARAQELLKQGHSYLDKNGDWVACKSVR
jgi:hypothetical protein